MLEHHLDRLIEREATLIERVAEGESPDAAKDLGVAVVVDGRTLAFCLQPKLEDIFIQVVSRCTSVLCCRATPLQKVR